MYFAGSPSHFGRARFKCSVITGGEWLQYWAAPCWTSPQQETRVRGFVCASARDGQSAEGEGEKNEETRKLVRKALLTPADCAKLGLAGECAWDGDKKKDPD